MKPTLIILAAGKGSRYGGMKQLDRFGPAGATIMEYSAFDALKAGFGKIVFVIRKNFEQEFASAVADRIRPFAPVMFAFQEADDLPQEFAGKCQREKPWGTGHAVYVARDLVNEPFAVINADDFYGREAFHAMAAFLSEKQSNQETGRYAMCGYMLGNTLSAYGSVSRGVCTLSQDGLLKGVREHSGIHRLADGSISGEFEGSPRKLNANDIVSMNFWGFTPELFDILHDKLIGFMRTNASSPSAEFYMPAVVDELIQEGRALASVLPSDASWFGVTYREDKQEATDKILELTRLGIYPTDLWAGQEDPG